MKPRHRDAILRVAKEPNYPAVVEYLSELRQSKLNSLGYSEPDNVAYIAKVQGMVQALDEVLAMVQRAEDALTERGRNE